MKTAANLVLVGPMGAGKTVLGRHLAVRLGLPFIDLDREIAKAADATIDAIFQREGEAAFREREHAALALALSGDHQVIAAGGGVVLDSRNRGLLRDRACVAWLSADVGTQLQRLEGCTDRPLLQVDGREARLHELHAQRQDLYQLVADLRVVTDGLSLDNVREILESKVRQSWPPAGAVA